MAATIGLVYDPPAMPAASKVEVYRSSDGDFMQEVARVILGEADVATSTAVGLRERGVDAARIDKIISGRGPAARIGGFEFKRIDADPETPVNFGLFVRRVRS